MPGVRSEEAAEIAICRTGHGDELLCAERDEQRQDDEPDPASAAPAARTARGTEPERLSQHRPAERPLLTPYEHHHEHELPDQPAGQRDDEGLRQRPWAAEVMREPWRDEPGEQCHRESGRGPDGE